MQQSSSKIFAPGVSVNTISDPLTKEALDALAQSGIASFETNMLNFRTPDGGVNEDLIDAFAAMTKATGKTSPTFHCPFGNDWDLSSPDEEMRLAAVLKLKGLFGRARHLGAKILVEHPSYEPTPEATRGVQIAQLRKSMRELEPLLKAENLKLALELLPRTCLGNSADELLAIADGFDATFGFCLDVNHLMSDIDKLPSATRRLGKRILCLHISDYHGIDEEHLMPGEGAIDWPAFIDALLTTGYRGNFNYELRLNGNCHERIAQIECNFKRLFEPLIAAGLKRTSAGGT